MPPSRWSPPRYIPTLRLQASCPEKSCTGAGCRPHPIQLSSLYHHQLVVWLLVMCNEHMPTLGGSEASPSTITSVSHPFYPLWAGLGYFFSFLPLLSLILTLTQEMQWARGA